MLPPLRQNGGWLLGQSTFDGMNHFYQLIKKNQDNPLWYCRVDSITNLIDEEGNRYITDEMIEEDRQAGMPEYLIQQEYYGVVEINQETKYFAHALNMVYQDERIIAELMIPERNVYAGWDIGINDCTAIVLFQVKRVQNFYKVLVIGYIENNNRDLEFYVMEVRRFFALGTICRSKIISSPTTARSGILIPVKIRSTLYRIWERRLLSCQDRQARGNAIQSMRSHLYSTAFSMKKIPSI